ncbi:methionyl-tRNA formyltransferase [Sphingomonas sp.]|uniref:methionyl-tRNA formyltransferase n=1 Tax=Sphingomonas sp. TaxID=28214 RepID=UPI00286CE4EE|nr:methionyl-tRNA formyltransferase [Sphingomonas sp.]
MRIIFMGSPAFAVPTLDAVVAAGHDVACVYTQPPRAAGRGKAERRTAVHDRAEALGLAVRHPVSLRDVAAQADFAAIGADVAVVAAYGLILPQPILDAPRLGCINVHGSLLPRWRGAAPVQRAIEAGDAVTGVTIMAMEKGLDTGPMLIRREIAIDRKDAGQLAEEIAKVGAAAMVEWLADPARYPPVVQPEGATYAAKIDKAETRIDWSLDVATIERKLRALAPAPGAWFEAHGERIKLLFADAVAGDASPGTVIDAATIACGSGALRLVTVQRAGRGAMTSAELLRGFALPSLLI